MRQTLTKSGSRAFTLIELLTVVSIIALLALIIMPALSAAQDMAKGSRCLSNLKSLGMAAGFYQADYQDYFWPYMETRVDSQGKVAANWYWGRFDASLKVDTTCSAFMKYCNFRLDYLWCPKQPWGSYVPQAGANEPTTNFGYNCKFLSPTMNGTNSKKGSDIKEPGLLFVFNDSAIWNLGGSNSLQNSTYLEPFSGNAVQTPTSHFRHFDKTHALCADGHAQAYGLEGGTMLLPRQKLGFVGTRNYPHYAQD